MAHYIWLFMFQIVSRSSITLTFQSGNHVIKAAIGVTEGLESADSPAIDELVIVMQSSLYLLD